MQPYWFFWRCLVVAALLGLPACTFLSDRQYVQANPQYRGVKRVAVFLQRWPVYLQLPGQNEPGTRFINKSTLFTGPWEPAGRLNPRAVDVLDITDELMGEIIVKSFSEKGYEPLLAGVLPSEPGPVTVAELMAKYQAVNPGAEAILFCFFSPTVYLAQPQPAMENRTRSYGLQEIIQLLRPGQDGVIWGGPRAGLAPPDSISHAFIYISMTMFRTRDWRPFWETADSLVGGPLKVVIQQCPPAPTQENYWANAAIIRNLMCDNLICRLKHLIPVAF
jgi:hypothetical protein